MHVRREHDPLLVWRERDVRLELVVVLRQIDQPRRFELAVTRLEQIDPLTVARSGDAAGSAAITGERVWHTAVHRCITWFLGDNDLGHTMWDPATGGAYDGLTAQALRYGDLLREDGVDVTVHEVDGVIHGYLNMVGILDAADAALDRHIDWLRTALS